MNPQLYIFIHPEHDTGYFDMIVTLEGIITGTGDLPPRPESAVLPHSPSSPPPPPRRFSPHHSLPGYVRRVGVSPLVSHSKNTLSLTRSNKKTGVARAVQDSATKTADSASVSPTKSYVRNPAATKGSNGNAGGRYSFGKRGSSGKVDRSSGEGGGLLGLLRGVSRSLERPNHPNASGNDTPSPGDLSPHSLLCQMF